MRCEDVESDGRRQRKPHRKMEIQGQERIGNGNHGELVFAMSSTQFANVWQA